MKLCLLSIATAFLSFVDATPVLAPRAPQFKLRGIGTSNTINLPPLQVKPIPGNNYQLGWFNPPAPEPILHFESDPSREGPAFDTLGHQMVFQQLAPVVPIYRVLLVKRGTTLPGMESTSYFTLPRDSLLYKGKVDGWFACGKGQGQFELYFSGGLPVLGCQPGYAIQLRVA